MSGPGAGTRVMLFTDTLGDVNGVSRFIRNVADLALKQGRALTVVTSTRFEVPRQANIVNVKPIAAWRMPKYENLEIVLPPALAMLRVAKEFRPDVIHISTPGSVGSVGRWIARRLQVQMAGVYHTDFPAYIEKLFQDDALTWACTRVMSYFYRPFGAVFTRSEEYKGAVCRLGVAPGRVLRLKPGIRVDEFHPRFRGGWTWGGAREAVRVLYVGRVSVEKNLPLLAKVWARVHPELSRRGVAAELVIVGDGPYRAEMERALEGKGVNFLGFKYGEELSRIYAACDMFAFPSLTDTLGQVVMEAQASGLPVLVADQGGPKEVVRNGETGFVLAGEDVAGWAARIVELCSEAPKRRAMGDAAHRFMQDYSIERSFEHYWGVHEEVAHGNLANDV